VDRVTRVKEVLGFNDPRAGTHDGIPPNMRAIVHFGVRRDPSARPDTVRLEDVEVRALYPDGKFLRFVAFGGYVLHEHVLVGGGAFDPREARAEDEDAMARNGFDGLWHMQGGGVCLRRDLPPERISRAAPEGLYKDLTAAPMSRLSLDYNRAGAIKSSKHAQRTVDAMLSMAEAALDEHVPQEPVGLDVPLMQVGTTGRIRFRFLQGWSKMAPLSKEMTAHVVRRTQSGDWTLPGMEREFCPNLQYGDIATVKAITADSVTLARTTDGATTVWTISAPVMRVHTHLKSVTGFDVTSLPVVPTVKPGEHVGHDTCLFGPSPKMPGLTDEQREGRARDAREEQVLLAEQLWAVLCLGEQIEGREYFPIYYALPTSSKDVRLKLRPHVNSTAYAGFQILPFKRGAVQQQVGQAPRIYVDRAQLKVREPGLRVNLYNCSHRGRISRNAAERRAREREQLQQPSAAVE